MKTLLPTISIFGILTILAVSQPFPPGGNVRSGPVIIAPTGGSSSGSGSGSGATNITDTIYGDYFSGNTNLMRGYLLLGGDTFPNARLYMYSTGDGDYYSIQAQSGGFITTADFTAGHFFGNGAGLTSLNATDLTSGLVSAARLANGQSLTNVPLAGLVSPTNYSSSTVIDFSVPEATTNLAGNLTFTGISNFSSTNYNTKIIHMLANGADRTITPAAGWRKGRSVFVVTNGTMADFYISCQINFFTNISQVDLF